MPVIPSFGAYAPKPDLAGAFLGAQRNQLQALQLAQEFQEAQARNQLGYAQIESQRAQNEAQLAATTAAKEQAFMIDQQRLAIDKAYKDASIGLQEAQLAETELKNAVAFKEAFQKFQAQEEYRKRFQGLDISGQKKLARELLPGMGFAPSPGMYEEEGAILNPPDITESKGRQFYTTRVGGEPRPLSEGGTEREPLVIPEVFEEGGQRFYRAEKGGKPIPIPEDQAQTVERMVWQTKVDSTRDDIDRLKEAITTGRASYPKDYKPKGKAAEIEKSIMDGIKAKEKELEDLEKKLQRLLDSAPIKATIPSTGATTNAMPRYTWSPTNRMVMPKK